MGGILLLLVGGGGGAAAEVPFASLSDVCDCLITALSREEWSVPFTADVRYRPEFTLEELAEIRVAVCPERVGKLRVGRRVWQEDATVTVGMQKRVDAQSSQQDVDCDTLVRVWDEVCEFLQHEDGLIPGAALVAVDATHCDRQHLLEHHCWTGTATLTYRRYRQQ